MKNIISLVLFVMMFINVTVYANELEFEPIGGGKFIYCNNPEGIVDDFILNGDTPRWIMNNESLIPDKYYIYLSHFNYTGNGLQGYDIELDMMMRANVDSEIIIHKAFFETPKAIAYYKDGKKITDETDWGQLNVCVGMLGVPLCDIRGDDVYYPEEYSPVKLSLKAGEMVWLSEYLSEYTAVNFGKAVHIQGLIEIRSGNMDFNVGAIKSGSVIGKRDDIPFDAEFGEYRWDYTLKGIADSLPEVKADIEYTITDETEDGEKIPVFLKNQYIPEGHTVTNWYTQINPQNDMWSKTLAAESDILTLYYKDDLKLDFYGEKIADSEKDNIWIFDTTRSAVRGFDKAYTEASEEYFMPNFILSKETANEAIACNLGNYGVVTTYCLDVTNETDETKYCSLQITASGEIMAYKTINGEKMPGYVKDASEDKLTDVMLSHEIPPQSRELFEFSLVLPVNYNGGMKNEFVITNENIQAVDFADKEVTYEKTKVINGKILTDVSLPETTAAKISGSGYELLKGKDMSLVRWCAWDGKPNWYKSLWGHVNTVYILDENNEIINSSEFPSLPCRASYNDGFFYVETVSDGIYRTIDGSQWEKTDYMAEYIPYYDLENASTWAKDELSLGWDEGLRLENDEDGYKFKEEISREDFCILAVKLLNKQKISEAETVEITFEDTSNPDIMHLASVGIIKGFPDGNFYPDDKITREQAAVILARLKEYVSPGDDNGQEEHSYSDDGDISLWAKEGVGKMHAIGVMHGIEENLFNPHGTYTREQAAITMLRLFNVIK